MSFTPEDKLSQILPVVISGGRRTLRQRPTARLLRDLHGITADPVWAVMDEDAADYEHDSHEIAVYSRTWAEKYAAEHWTALKPLEPGGFLGAFTGREYACRLAEERGYWAVLQLDDNIRDICCFRHRSAGVRVAANHGGLGMFADILAAVTLSTNGWMTGAFLASVSPNRWSLRVSRTGFPYSLFVERIGPGRENWHGPFEDDIIHAYQYGSNASPATALVVPMLVYMKETESKTGMRARYNHERAVPLQRMFPESARVSIQKSHSNGRGGPRVFHTMTNAAIRTPMIITDRERYSRIAAHLTALAEEFTSLYRQDVRAKVSKRASRYADPPATGVPPAS
jgi:hypothetical protein